MIAKHFELIKSIIKMISCCPPVTVQLIFVQTSVASRAVFFTDTPLDRRDPRVRSVPFETRRPTQQEISRAYAKLHAVYQHDGASTVYIYILW
jgi:hypothetical protein